MSKLLCVAGPTATGKSALAVSLALRLGGEVVSCDSVQIYKGFDIGSAKISTEEQRGVPHHMLSIAAPGELWSAGRYARAARVCIEDIRARGALPILCGGTGLWLRALTEGLAELPDCPRLEHGPDAYTRLREVDPVAAAKLSPADRQRIHRALDVFKATGRPLSSFWAAAQTESLPALVVGLDYPDRTLLRDRIARRTAEMLRAGLWQETEALLKNGVPADAPPMKSLGYAQALRYLSGELSEREAEEEITLRTAQYAKRQRTWFARQSGTVWFPAPPDENNLETILKFVEKNMTV